jgi:hypothetical protein
MCALERSLLFFGFFDWQTGQWQPIIGTPADDPVPMN